MVRAAPASREIPETLKQVELGVGGESLAAVGRRPDDGKGAVPERLVEVEGLSQLLRHKGVEVAAHGTPGEQIGPRGLELAGARSTEDEAKPPILDVTMDLVEHRWEALDLVHDDHGSGR